MISALKQNPIVKWMFQFREPVSGFTHAFGAVLALIGMVWLVWVARHTPGRAITLAIFGTTMVMVYIASTTMHLYVGSKQMIFRLNQIDHAAIYLLIAGTYTPFIYVFFDGAWRWGFLMLIWSLAFIGLTIKLFFHMYGHASTVFYILMGWMAILALPHFLMNNGFAPLTWILIGGIVYTVGAIIFAMKWPNFHKHFGSHEIWHLFVIGGSACHFLAAYIYVA